MSKNVEGWITRPLIMYDEEGFATVFPANSHLKVIYETNNPKNDISLLDCEEAMGLADVISLCGLSACDSFGWESGDIDGECETY